MKAHPIFASFTTGEGTPLIFGRVDFAKYASALRILLNYLIRPHGPVFRRPGTHFVGEVKDSTKFTRLLKFEFSTTQAYQIEAGDLYFRFLKDGGRIFDSPLYATGFWSQSGLVGYDGTKVNDGNLGNLSFHTDTSVAGAYLLYDFGSAPGVSFTQVVITISSGNQGLAAWTFEYSDDNVAFTPVGSVTPNGPAGQYTTTLAWNHAAPHRYWRMRLTNTPGGGTWVNEVQFGLIVEIATPYTAAALPTLKSIQSADTLYLFHANYAPRKLTRQSHTSWTLTTVNFLPPPTFEGGFAPAMTLTLSATTGLGVTATAGVASFLESDVGRLITVGLGRASIRSIGGAGPNATATVDVVDDFASVGPHASQAWTIQGSPNTGLTPSASQPAHAITTLTLDANGWRSTEVGRYVRVNKGVVRITKYTSATVVEAEILTDLLNISKSPGGSWSTEDPMWTAARGYPTSPAFHEQRMVAGGSAATPQAFHGSNSGEYEVFGLGPDDDDAYEFVIAANEVNPISWIVPTAKLLIGTASTEFSVKGSDGASNAAISPNSVDVKASTFWGSSARVPPIRIGNAVLFVSRTGTELREMVFSIERDSYIANDMLLLADHLTDGFTITDMAYQRHPNSVVWCVRNDGALLALTYQREHDVVGWSRHLTGATALFNDGVDADHNTLTIDVPNKGKFESVCVTPHWNGDRDAAFFVVQRTLASGSKRYIEYMDDVNGYYGGLGMDCALTYTGTATSTLSGLSHLEGETVTVLVNGAVYPTAVVTGGAITLPADHPQATRAEVGIGFTSVLETMRPEVPQQGTSQGVMKHWNKVWVRLYRSIGLWLNGEEQHFRTPADAMDAALPRFTGDKDCGALTRDRDSVIRIEQRDPLPQTVCAVFGELGLGEE